MGQSITGYANAFYNRWKDLVSKEEVEKLGFRQRMSVDAQTVPISLLDIPSLLRAFIILALERSSGFFQPATRFVEPG